MRKLKIMFALIVASLIVVVSGNEVYAESAVTSRGNYISIANGGNKYSETLGGILCETHWFKASISIGEFNLSGQDAFCTNHKLKSPDSDDTVTAYLYTSDTDGYDAKVATALYYGYGGPGCIVSNDYAGYYATTYVLYKIMHPETITNYDAFEDTLNGIDKAGGNATELYKKASDGAIPDSDFCYILYVPDDSSLQTTATVAGIRTKAGNLTVIKQDQYGNRVEGAQYLINGQKYTTNSNGELNIEGLTAGTYTVQEVYVPSPLILDSSVKTIEVTAGNTTTVTFTNTYQRGSVYITKYSSLNTEALGDSTLEGAQFSLYAAEDIYEGKNLVYSKDYLIQSGITTDADGKTAAVGDLPVGTYYYVETKASEGFLINDTKVYVTIEYAGQDASVAAEAYNTVPETQIFNYIEINKQIGETSNTDQAPLDGCEFTVILKEYVDKYGSFEEALKHTDEYSEYEWSTITIGDDCYGKSGKLVYGEYVVSETTVSPISLKCADFVISIEEDYTVHDPYTVSDAIFLETTLPEEEGITQTYDTSYEWVDDDGNLVDIPKVMKIKIRKQDIDGYNGGEAVDYTQGDATLKGAVFSIYRYDPQTDDYTEYVYDITVDHKDSDGYWCAESDELLVGKYMVVEKVQYTETGEDGVTYNYSYAEGYLVGDGVNPVVMYFDQEPSAQTTRITYHTDVALNQVERGSVEVIKYYNNVEGSEETAAEGAVLRLTLDSDDSIYYEVVINANGYGNFLDTNDDTHTASIETCYGYKYYPYTIPYGQYTITEVSESKTGEHTSFYVQPESVTVKKNTQQEYRIEADEPTPAYLKIVKYDADTGEEVVLSGARFKIWSVDDDDWVTFKTYPDFADITEIESNDEGYVITPQQLQPGTYVIYEVEAPDGYYLEDDLRVPENEAYLGNVDYGGQEVVVDKRATGLADDAVYPEGGYTGDLYIQVDIYDRPLKVQLEIYKTGEVLTTSTESGTIYGSKYTPVWEERGLEGVTYNIVAAEDIMSPDGRITYVKEGTVVDTITTGEDGYATTDELYPGTYSIVEIDTPDGYLIDDNIENVTLTNENEYERVKLHKKELGDIRQKLELTFEKIFEEIQYSTTQKLEQKAVFGVYTNEDIYNYKGQRVISKDSLVDVITVTENNSYATSTIDLPEGSYYVMELEVSYPYVISDEVQYFTLKYTSDKTQEFVVVEGEDVENTYYSAPLILLKLSTTSTDADHVLSLSGSDLTEESLSNLDNLSKEITEAVKNLTADETLTYITDLLEKISGSTELTEDEKEEETNKILTVSGVTYQVFVDEECTQPLYKLNEETGEYTDTVTITTDLTGAGIIYGIPYGTYYVKEVSAPAGYKISSTSVQILVNETTGIPKVFQITYDDSTLGKVITKTDIFTGDVVPNCTFEITDEKGELLVHSITDDEGNAYVPVDLFEDGKTYYYTEIDAPDIYELNTDSHAFVAQIDEETGEWTADPIEVENIRKTSTVTLIKLDMMDSTPIPNCKFELRSLETDFVVEGVTDENGIYVFENIPYGEYTYTELEAPEEYQIDTTPHEITIDAEEITIQVTNQLVDTSDIAVIALVFVSILSIAGIVIVTSKNRKKSSIS